MRGLLERRYLLRQHWLAMLGFALCLYFSYHLLQGERSYIRLIGLHQAIAKTELSYKDTQAEREKLERRVQMLRPGTINPDYLEERARAVLGYRTPEERDVILGASSSKPPRPNRVATQ